MLCAILTIATTEKRQIPIWAWYQNFRLGNDIPVYNTLFNYVIPYYS